MGIEALVPRPGTSKAAPGHKIYLSAARREHHESNPCLGQRHHLYSDGAWLLVSGGDYRLGHPGSSGVAPVEHDGYGFCITALDEALARHGNRKYPTPIRARQSPAPPSPACSRLRASRFRWTDAVVHGQHFHRTIGRSIKYEEVHLKAYVDGAKARDGIGSW